METLPMALDAMDASEGGLDDFRIHRPSEVAAYLRQLLDGNVLLNLNAPDGAAITGTLWSVDADRQTMSLSVDPLAPQFQTVLAHEEAVVVGYLDNVKIQFDVDDMVLVRSGQAAALKCSLPRQLFRFQRRNSFRVRPVPRSAPQACFAHPVKPSTELRLRVLDVSIGGIALLLTEDVPLLDRGTVLPDAVLELDADTRVHTALRIQHATASQGEMPGTRLGCEMLRTNGDGLRQLQRYIDQTQKRKRLLSLD
jgi:c-di-GMP-binding flagellar brake protein YcgR